jgi:hypothetical protein
MTINVANKLNEYIQPERPDGEVDVRSMIGTTGRKTWFV